MKYFKTILFAVPFLILGYSLLYEPFNLESTFHEVTIGTSGKKLLIGHISDLHTTGMGKVEKKLIESLSSKKPDIIFITGDIATPKGTSKGYEEVLSNFKAPLGVYFVQGNWEYWEPIKELSEILKRTNIVNLTNKHQLIIDDLWLIGLDDALAGSPLLNIFNNIPANKKIISIFHSPVLFSSIKGRTNLAFAGHSHGGQVRLPFDIPIWTPEGTGQYYSGWFQDGISKLFVSRGIGNSILPLRFNCKPEVAYIKVNY